MKIFYHDLFTFPLPETHRFPIDKYQQLRQHVLESQIVPPENLIVPSPASDAQISLAHSTEYIRKIADGDLDDKEIRRLGFPWSPSLVERSRYSVGSTIAAARAAMEDGAAVSLAGGTHHAAADHGEGFCVFNDVAIAAKVLQAEGLAQKTMVIDCDVHQGNGTASILQNDATVFTFSIHGEKNFPFRKVASDLDIGLPDNTRDAEYLTALHDGLTQAFAAFTPELIIYLAGADPYEKDRLGRLSITKAGLAHRDRTVFDASHQRKLPVSVVMAGGYAPNTQDIIEIHFQTILLALEYENKVKFSKFPH